MMSRVEAYLQIPGKYHGFEAFDLRWSAGGDAIEYADGTTMCFAAEVALFLEGYASVGPLIHFAHIVNLLLLLDERSVPRRASVMARHVNWFTEKVNSPSENEESLAPYAEWARRYRQAGRRARNAGALCARICRELPITVDPPDAREIILRLGDGSLRAAMAVHRDATSPLADEVEAPSIPGFAFERFFIEEMGKISREEVDHWLRHGTAPTGDVGPEIAREVIARKPPAVAGLLENLEARERLAGAAPMVAQLVGALALPPRRRADHRLPTGGYADVGNRGSIDQILPGQLALDADEFVRRFAENELLFFRREEPHEPIGEDLSILLDQGVRCWGRVRLVLAAAAIALGRNADRKGRPWRIGGTSTDGLLLDPTNEDPDALAAFWEASDLSAHPAPALEAVLESQAADPPTPGDVVVLSHPRSLLDPAFAASARRAGPATRLFTVSADDSGRVEMAEWRHGAKVPMAAFRVEPRSDPAPIPKPKGDPTAWSGDIEPVPYPFRMGLDQPADARDFDFDHGGRRLGLATRHGFFYAWSLDGSTADMLPRAMIQGAPMAACTAVRGVADGFIVGGRSEGGAFAAIHYDVAGRVVRTYLLAPAEEGNWQWFYFRGLHAVVARNEADTVVLDLATATMHRSGQGTIDPSGVAGRAIRLASTCFVPPPTLVVLGGPLQPDRGGVVALDARSGTIQIDRVEPPWSEFTPMHDGRPALEGGRIDMAQLRGEVLALLAGPATGRCGLMLFRGPAGRLLRELPVHPRCNAFILSADGRLIAVRLGDGPKIMVLPTSGADGPSFVVPPGKSHPGLILTLGPMGMAVRVGRRAIILAWGTGQLVTWSVPGDDPLGASATPGGGRDAGPLTVPASKMMTLPSALERGGKRYVACARSSLTAVVDRFGQIALFDADERLVAMVLVSRGQVAAWMPDGTRLGPPTLIDGADADAAAAAKAIGHALREASLRNPR